MNIGNKIKQRRQELDMNQDTLAEMTGYSRAMICKIEKGSTNFPFSKIDDFAKALKVDPYYFFSEFTQIGRQLDSDTAYEDIDILRKIACLNGKNKVILTNIIDVLIDSQL